MGCIDYTFAIDLSCTPVNKSINSRLGLKLWQTTHHLLLTVGFQKSPGRMQLRKGLLGWHIIGGGGGGGGLLEILKDFQFHLNEEPFASLQVWSQQMTMTLHHRRLTFK